MRLRQIGYSFVERIFAKCRTVCALTLRCSQILPALAGTVGYFLEKWKWRRDRKSSGIWIGPPPRLLSKKDLICGDVLFCGDTRHGKMSRLIQNASSGGYVHCALYIGSGLVVDVVGKGVRKIPLNEFVKTYSYVAITRCPGNERFRTRRKKILKFARASLSGRIKGYSFLGAALSPLRELYDLKNLETSRKRLHEGKRWRNPPSKRAFCSEFVIEAYVACGYIPRDYRFLSPSRRTPSGLAEENMFELSGYMSSSGWNGVNPDDHFLGGCSWALS